MPCAYNDGLIGGGCQFNEPEEDLNKYSPRRSPQYCVLHLESGWKTDWHEEEINEFNRVFNKYLDLYINSPTGSISFRGVVFPGNIDLSNREFSKTLDFLNCVFMHGLSFDKSNINTIQILKSSFGSLVCFDNSSVSS